MIGLIESAVASMAFALPMRPPFFRLSSVSSAPKTRVRATRSWASASMSSMLAPSRAARAHASTIVPRPMVIVRLSTTRTSRSMVSSAMIVRAASWADCMVADNADDSEITITLVAPLAAAERYACSNWPGAGAAVSGSVSELTQRVQNSAVDNSERSTNSSSPNRIVSGMMLMSSSSAMSAGRSHELSVTTCTEAAAGEVVFFGSLTIRRTLLGGCSDGGRGRPRPVLLGVDFANV